MLTIVSRHATRLWLLLFDAPDADHPARQIELTPERHRFGPFWQIALTDAELLPWYLWRAEGPAPYFTKDQWLLDPAAPAIEWNRAWGDPNHLTPGQFPRNGRSFPKGLLVREEPAPPPRTPSPRTPWNDTIIYETHLRGFTAHASSRSSHPGTFDGFREKIPHLQELGITAVEFLPLHDFNEMEFFLENGSRKALKNFWGYSTLGYFAPMSRYAARGASGARAEFRNLVWNLHAAGIEVFLDVVFNHTGEFGKHGPVFSFRGLDEPLYYLHKANGAELADFTGCGNTVNANHPLVKQFILESLRHWVRSFQIDGFRFDLASALTRGADGQPLDSPALIRAISEDPVLRDTKLIAEAWDAGGLHQVGRFPGTRWAEWNGAFRDDVRKFWNGHHGTAASLATRISGSSDLYGALPAGPLKSINFITAHDGFTLRDLVSYSHRHNEANGEHGRDGEPHNHSSNGGVEGPTDQPAIQAARDKRRRCLLATLLVSQGVPMLLGGDEFGRTQRGNNNAYNQDNEISWVNWDLATQDAAFLEFSRALIAFRRAHPALRRTSFFSGRPDAHHRRDIAWQGPGPAGTEPRWQHDTAVAMKLDGAKSFTGAGRDDADIWIIFNAGAHSAIFHPPPGGKGWALAWSTETAAPAFRADGAFEAPAFSVTAFTS